MGWAKQLAAPLHESLLRTYEQGMARYMIISLKGYRS
jgi:hypothetical protein